METAPASRNWALPEYLLLATIAAGALHHVDHVLRYDHSGWPFREVTPFTYSLLAYPVLLFALFGPTEWRWLKFALVALGAALTVAAHVFLETPADQYFCWANNASLDPRAAGHPNLLNIRSPELGALAVGNAMLLNVLLVAAAIGLFARATSGRR